MSASGLKVVILEPSRHVAPLADITKRLKMSALFAHTD
jgi:hypothetical protein